MQISKLGKNPFAVNLGPKKTCIISVCPKEIDKKISRKNLIIEALEAYIAKKHPEIKAKIKKIDDSYDSYDSLKLDTDSSLKENS